MQVAIDFAGHWEVRSGVWRYGIALTKALVRSGQCESVRVPCFDRLPAKSLGELAETGADVSARGLHRHLDRLEAMARRRGRYVPWSRFLPLCLDHGLRASILRGGLGGSDVYHSLCFLRERVRGVRMAVTIHDLIPLLAPGISALCADRFRQNLERCRRECDVVIVPSEATKRELIERAAFEASRIHVVYHGIDHEYFSPDADGDEMIHRRHGLKAREYLFYVGAIDRRKNLSTLLDAYLLARRSKNSSFPLVLAGPVVGDMRALMERLQGLECRHCVKYLGYCSDAELPALYRGARAFCFVSLYEGFGFPPLEAMACGTPVITSETSSLGEIVGDAAMTVNPHDAEQLADAIGILSQDDGVWSEFRNAGIAHARRFTWMEAAAATFRAYSGGSGEEFTPAAASARSATFSGRPS